MKSINEIKEIVSDVAKQYGVEKVYLFGSYARGEQREDSDIDLHIYEGDIRGLFQLSRFHLDLEGKLNTKVDFLTGDDNEDKPPRRFKTTIIQNILSEEVLIYERVGTGRLS